MPTTLHALVQPSPRTTRLDPLIRQHGKAIGAFLERLGVARADVDDARQRVWLTVVRCFERIHPGSERAFLFSVARREAGHVRRSRRRRCEVMETCFDELAGESVLSDERLERRQILEQACAVLEGMDQSLRTVLWLSEIDDATAQDIAGLLQIPIGTVKSRLRRARTECARRVAAGAPRVVRDGLGP
jgi:RNA polymerase sigma-70 factor (ECF subfamily)